MQKQYLFFL